jgi:hypothetical protein
MAAGLDLGTLTVKLAADVEDLKKGLAEATRQTEATNKALKRMGDVAFGAVEGLGGAFNEASTMLRKARKGVEDLFGENATAAGQAWGDSLRRSIGLTEAQVKGLGQAVKGLEGAFEIAAMASKALVSPLGAALLGVVGLTAAWGGLKQLLNTKGWLPEFMDEPWFQAFKPSATPGWEGVDFKRRAPGPKGAAAEQAYGKFFDPTTGRYTSAGPVASVPDPGPSGPGIGERAKEGFASAMEGFVKSLKEGAKDLEPALKAFMDMFDNLAPGAKKKSEDAKKKASVNEWSSYDEKGAADLKRTQEKFADAQIDMRYAEQAMFERTHQEYLDTQQMELDALKERQRKQRALDDMAADAIKEAYRKTEARWDALGSGRIGTTLGIKGLAGGVLDQLGGAAAGYQRMAAVLQCAASGMQSSGGSPYGAIIGAIIGLLTQTQSFSAIMEGIEGVLGSVVDALDSFIEPVLNFLEPILDLISGIFDLVAVGFDAINGLISDDGLGKSIGDKESQWGKYSVNDWLTLTPLINEAGKELEKIFSGDKEITEWKEIQKANMESLQAQTTQAAASYYQLGEGDYQRQMESLYYAQRLGSDRQHDVEMGIVKRYEADHAAEIQARYLADSLYELGGQAKASANELLLLSTSSGAEAYIVAQVKAAEVQAKKTELDLIVQDRLAALGLAADSATKAVAQFADAFLNVPIGYKLALSQFGAQSAAGAGGGGGGGGGPSNMPAPAAGGGGGGGGGGTVNVTIQSDDPNAIWSKLKQLMARDNYVRGGTIASRAPVGV